MISRDTPVYAALSMSVSFVFSIRACDLPSAPGLVPKQANHGRLFGGAAGGEQPGRPGSRFGVVHRIVAQSSTAWLSYPHSNQRESGRPYPDIQAP